MSNAFRTVMKVLAVALTFPLAGCQQPIPGPIEPREDPAGWPQIQIADRDLRNRIVVRRPQIMQDEAGLMFVTVPVRSTTERQLTIEYRATFFDRNHEVIQETTWFPKTLPPFTQETLTLNSTSPRADDFQFDIRPAK